MFSNVLRCFFRFQLSLTTISDVFFKCNHRKWLFPIISNYCNSRCRRCIIVLPCFIPHLSFHGAGLLLSLGCLTPHLHHGRPLPHGAASPETRRSRRLLLTWCIGQLVWVSLIMQDGRVLWVMVMRQTLYNQEPCSLALIKVSLWVISVWLIDYKQHHISMPKLIIVHPHTKYLD